MEKFEYKFHQCYFWHIIQQNVFKLRVMTWFSKYIIYIYIHTSDCHSEIKYKNASQFPPKHILYTYAFCRPLYMCVLRASVHMRSAGLCTYAFCRPLYICVLQASVHMRSAGLCTYAFYRPLCICVLQAHYQSHVVMGFVTVHYCCPVNRILAAWQQHSAAAQSCYTNITNNAFILFTHTHQLNSVCDFEYS